MFAGNSRISNIVRRREAAPRSVARPLARTWMSIRRHAVSGTHSRSPVSSDKQVTAKVLKRIWRFCDEEKAFLPESREDAIKRLITVFRSCTRASFRRSPLASCLTRKLISPMSPYWLPLQAVCSSRFTIDTLAAGITNAVIRFGLAFEGITLTSELKSRIRGTCRGKRSFDLPRLSDDGRTAVSAV
jgi:hypothetical protein